MKRMIFVIGVLIFSLISCVEKSNHEKALGVLDDLSTELMSCTTQEKYDVVYEKVIAIQNDPKFGALEGQTYEQKMEIVAGTTQLVQEALAVKAILFVMPSGIEPTEKDIRTLVNICLDRNLNITRPPYSDIHAVLCEYYKL